MGKRATRRSANNKSQIHQINQLAPSSPHNGTRYVKNIRPKTPTQGILIDSLEHEGITLAIGPAGTGKTFLAVAKAVDALESCRVDKIILCRPAVDAGETLGFLPGNIDAKLAPYLRPIHDALVDRLGGKRVKALMAEGIIEIAPIAYLRGRTFNNAFVLVDEAQNCTYPQLKMLVTRYGWRTTMVLAGDPQQSDLLPGISGLMEMVDRLRDMGRVSIVDFCEQDVIRHPLVADMLAVL